MRLSCRSAQCLSFELEGTARRARQMSVTVIAGARFAADGLYAQLFIDCA